MGGAPRQQFGSCALSLLQQREGGEEGAERGRGDWTGRSTHFEAGKGLSGAPDRSWHGLVGEQKELGFVRSPTGRVTPCFQGRHPSCSPFTRAPHSRYPTLRNSLPRACAHLFHFWASEMGTQSLHAAAPSGSSRFFSHLSHPLCPAPLRLTVTAPAAPGDAQLPQGPQERTSTT